MPTSVLEALADKSVARDFNNDNAITGSNSRINSKIFVEEWEEWSDFTYKNIKNIFKKQLSQKYKGENEPRPLSQDLFVLKEDTTDDALRRFPMPIVNYALDSVNSTAGHFGRGSRCQSDENYFPDWSVVSTCHKKDGQFLNILPGDTKISSKWNSDMDTSNLGVFVEWRKVLIQAVTYMAMWSVRYGFIVTDTEVVVLRIARTYTPTGLAAGRPAREGLRSGSDATITLSSDPLSVPSSGDVFEDTDPLQWDYSVSYRATPWSVYGRGQLTAKLALWALATMSSCGDRDIDYSYPGLDTWRTGDGGGIIHNTSGAVLDKPTKGCRMEERNPGWHRIVSSAEGRGDAEQEDRGGDDNAHRTDANEDTPYEEPDLPQLSRAASTAREFPAASASASASAPAPVQGPQAAAAEGKEKAKEEIETRVTKKGNQYYYSDYKGIRKSSVKSDWVKESRGYILYGNKHNYFAKKLP